MTTPFDKRSEALAALRQVNRVAIWLVSLRSGFNNCAKGPSVWPTRPHERRGYLPARRAMSLDPVVALLRE